MKKPMRQKNGLTRLKNKLGPRAQRSKLRSASIVLIKIPIK